MHINITFHPLRFCLLLGCLFLFPVIGIALPLTSNGYSTPSLSPMLKEVTLSVVHISTQAATPSGKSPLLKDPEFRQFYDRLRPSERSNRRALGSGTIVDAEKGYILTNQHVIDGGDTIQATLKNGRVLAARLVGADPQTDIALLQVKADNLTALDIADSDTLEVGDFVVAIGSPYGLTQTVTSGIVSALGRSQLGFQGFENFIQTDATTNPGNSGGPLVNLQGELVGVNTAILSPSGSNIGIGFAVPGNTAKSIMQQIIEHGDIKRGIFGINVEDLSYEWLESRQLERLKGALINQVKAGSPAEQGGLRVGDIVIEFNDKPVTSANQLHNMLGLKRVGEEVEVAVYRDGFRLEYAATIADPYENYVAGDSISPYLEGARLTNFVDDIDNNKLEGIAIGDIQVGSSAWRVGLRERDIVLGINKTQINNLDMARQLLADESPMFHIRVQRDGQVFNLVSPE